MGSSFIAYGAFYAVMLLAGQEWLKRRNKSQEFFDSFVIALWGLVNTFTEHRFGKPWSHKDLQHTSMGIIWWCGGLVGMLTATRNGPKRSIIPAVIIFITGWAMSSHAQNLMISTKMHAVFGYTLMAAGATRVIEIAFLLRDRNEAEDSEVYAFQYLPPFLLIASGLLFMGSNEEQMILLNGANMDHVSYALVIYSIAFIIYFLVLALINLYQTSGKNDIKNVEENGYTAGSNLENNAEIERQVQQAGEFELEELLDDQSVSDASENFIREVDK